MSTEETKTEDVVVNTIETLETPVQETVVQQPIPTNIWLQFDTITIGAVNSEPKTYDLRAIFDGLERLATVTIVREEKIEEVKEGEN